MRGKIGDRPWGATLATIGLGGHSGQLVLTGDDKRQFKIAFANGVVIGAGSPVPVDSLARIALSMKLLPAPIAKALGRVEDIEKFAAAASLGPTQIQALKRRVIVQRAARTFAVDAGKYVLEEKITFPVMLGIEVDIRAAIYEGIRMNLSEQRLTKTMHGIGSRFVLRSDQTEELVRFGFGDLEEPVLAALREGTSLPELEATRRDIDPRMAEAVICALALCDAVTEITVTRVPTPREPTISRVPTPREPTMSAVPVLIPQDATTTRVPTPREPLPRIHARAATEGRVPTPPDQQRRIVPRPASMPPPIPRAAVRRPFADPFAGAPSQLGPDARRAAMDPGAPRVSRTMTDPFLDAQQTTVRSDERFDGRPTHLRPATLSLTEVRQLITIGVQLLERGVDHFTFLGLPYGAPVEAVREAYIEFARYLRPERLAALGIADDDHDARSVFAQVVIAYTVLSDPRRRAEYLDVQAAARS